MKKLDTNNVYIHNGELYEKIDLDKIDLEKESNKHCFFSLDDLKSLIKCKSNENRY